MDKGEIMWGKWIDWQGGECPIADDDIMGEVQFASGDTAQDTALPEWRWTKEGGPHDIIAYRLFEPSEQSEREDVPEAKPTKHPHYHKDVSHLTSIDVYRVLDLYGVTDQAIGHAAKKLLVAGGRGHKDISHDVQDVIDTLERWKEMQIEDMKCG